MLRVGIGIFLKGKVGSDYGMMMLVLVCIVVVFVIN